MDHGSTNPTIWSVRYWKQVHDFHFHRAWCRQSFMVECNNYRPWVDPQCPSRVDPRWTVCLMCNHLRVLFEGTFPTAWHALEEVFCKSNDKRVPSYLSFIMQSVILSISWAQLHLLYYIFTWKQSTINFVSVIAEPCSLEACHWDKDRARWGINCSGFVISISRWFCHLRS